MNLTKEQKRALIQNVAGLIAVGLLVIYPTPSEMTSWGKLYENFISFVSSPYNVVLLLTVINGYLKDIGFDLKRLKGGSNVEN